jgi:hypothetical protein
MNYTREQAEAVLKDLRAQHGLGNDLSPLDIKYLNAKFPTIEVGKWIVDDKFPDFFMLIKGKNNEGRMFTGIGRSDDGEWVADLKVFTQDKGNRLATDQEVLDRLTEEAKKRYKLGDRVVSVWIKSDFIISNYETQIDEAFLYMDDTPVLNLSTGKWAEVVELNPIHDKIEKLERELAELKQLINQ